MDTLFAMEPIGTEDDPIGDQGEGEIIYDDIDSSKTIDEEIVDLMTKNAEDELSEEEEVCIGTDLDQFIGHEFSIPNATDAWMKWDVKRPH